MQPSVLSHSSLFWRYALTNVILSQKFTHKLHWLCKKNIFFGTEYFSIFDLLCWSKEKTPNKKTTLYNQQSAAHAKLLKIRSKIYKHIDFSFEYRQAHLQSTKLPTKRLTAIGGVTLNVSRLTFRQDQTLLGPNDNVWDTSLTYLKRYRAVCFYCSPVRALYCLRFSIFY